MRAGSFSLAFFLSAAFAATKQEIYILRDELGIERQQLQNIDDELGQLNRQQLTLQRNLNIRIADGIRDNNVEIQNLTELLQTQRAREGNIDRSVDSYLNQIVASSRANQEQIGYNLQDVERRMRQTQDQINFSPLYTASATITADPARQILQTEYTQLVQQLNLLREQRERASALQLEQIQLLNNDRAYQKTQLLEDLAGLQERLSTLRSENARLEAERVQTQLSLAAVQQQLSQQQKRSEEQQRKVQTLDADLQKQSF